MEMRRPGLEPGTPAWKADMLTPTPTTQKNIYYLLFTYLFIYLFNYFLIIYYLLFTYQILHELFLSFS